MIVAAVQGPDAGGLVVLVLVVLVAVIFLAGGGR